MSKCLKPIHLKNGNVVPCGRCYQCRSRIRSEWAFRIQQELDNNADAYFATLTYDDNSLVQTLTPYYIDVQNNIFQPLNHLSENLYYVKYDDNTISTVRPDKLQDWQIPYLIEVSDLPKYTLTCYSNSVQKEHIKLFTDKFQHFLKRHYNAKLTYFVCAEYGELGRPHYHAIFILSNRVPDFDKHLSFYWHYGFVNVSKPESNGAISYCLKYLLKGAKIPEGALRTFSLKSKAIGKQFIENTQNQKYLAYQLLESPTLSASVTFRDSQKSIPLPRYYQTKILEKHAQPELLPLRTVTKMGLSKQRDLLDFKQKFLEYYNKFLRDKPLTHCTTRYAGYKINLEDFYTFQKHYNGLHTIQYLDKQDKNRTTIHETDGQ